MCDGDDENLRRQREVVDDERKALYHHPPGLMVNGGAGKRKLLKTLERIGNRSNEAVGHARIHLLVYLDLCEELSASRLKESEASHASSARA
jgi:hypothetical protein